MGLIKKGKESRGRSPNHHDINEEDIRSASDPVPGAEVYIEQEPVGYLPEEGFEKRGESKEDDQNLIPLATIELTVYCRIVPHQVPGELVPELRMAGGGDPLKGLNTGKEKLKMQLKQKRAEKHKNDGPYSQSMSNLDDN